MRPRLEAPLFVLLPGTLVTLHRQDSLCNCTRIGKRKGKLWLASIFPTQRGLCCETHRTRHRSVRVGFGEGGESWSYAEPQLPRRPGLRCPDAAPVTVRRPTSGGGECSRVIPSRTLLVAYQHCETCFLICNTGTIKLPNL